MTASEDRRGDTLRWIDRRTLQDLLAAYYRDLGWWVEDAAEEACLDGACLVLKRDRDILLLDGSHWGADRRPDDAVASLIRAVERAGATGGILVDRGSFSRAEHEAANRHGHIRLIDDDGLRGMLGDVPEHDEQAAPQAPPPASPLPTPQVTRHRRPPVRAARRGTWLLWLVALVCLVVFILLVRALLARTADTAMPPETVAGPAPAAAPRGPSGAVRLDEHAAAGDAAAHMLAARAAALRGDQAAVEAELHAANDGFRRAIRLADPARRVDRESARVAVRDVPGVRSAVWIDHENLFVIVSANAQRSHATIDAVCSALAPLGDTLGVVVHLQSAAARNADELAILDRNCQLAPGERALLQSHRQVDVVPEHVRAQHRARNPADDRDQGRNAQRLRSDEAIRVIESSTPEM
ncbi:MAG: restriction endonuclease [Lysobacter sp.]|nr:restriction endonuclease [Lysobacter sp.]